MICVLKRKASKRSMMRTKKEKLQNLWLWERRIREREKARRIQNRQSEVQRSSTTVVWGELVLRKTKE